MGSHIPGAIALTKPLSVVPRSDQHHQARSKLVGADAIKCTQYLDNIKRLAHDQLSIDRVAFHQKRPPVSAYIFFEIGVALQNCAQTPWCEFEVAKTIQFALAWLP